MVPILFQGRKIDLEDPVFVRLINSETPEHRLAFAQEFGDLGGRDIAHFAENLSEVAGPLLGLDDAAPYPNYAVDLANLELKGARLEPRFENRSGRAHLVLEAPDLAQFMIFELAAAVEAGAKSKRCEHCRRFFLHGPLTGNRGHAKYHANRCRVAAMRARKASGENPS